MKNIRESDEYPYHGILVILKYVYRVSISCGNTGKKMMLMKKADTELHMLCDLGIKKKKCGNVVGRR